MIENFWNGEGHIVRGSDQLQGGAGIEEVSPVRLHPVGETEANLLGADRNEFPHWAFHHHRIRKVHQMHRQRVLLLPDGYVENARPGDLHHRRLVERPFDRVAEEFKVIDTEDFPKGAVDVPGK